MKPWVRQWLAPPGELPRFGAYAVCAQVNGRRATAAAGTTELAAAPLPSLYAAGAPPRTAAPGRGRGDCTQFVAEPLGQVIAASVAPAAFRRRSAAPRSHTKLAKLWGSSQVGLCAAGAIPFTSYRDALERSASGGGQIGAAIALPDDGSAAIRSMGRWRNSIETGPVHFIGLGLNHAPRQHIPGM